MGWEQVSAIRSKLDRLTSGRDWRIADCGNAWTAMQSALDAHLLDWVTLRINCRDASLSSLRKVLSLLHKKAIKNSQTASCF